MRPGLEVKKTDIGAFELQYFFEKSVDDQESKNPTMRRSNSLYLFSFGLCSITTSQGFFYQTDPFVHCQLETLFSQQIPSFQNRDFNDLNINIKKRQ